MIAAAADDDFRDIVAWTHERFGARQARVYATTLGRTIRALAEGPGIVGAKRRPEVASGVSTIHVAREGRRGSHFVVFRAREADLVIEVLRILHESSDLPPHVDDSGEGAE